MITFSVTNLIKQYHVFSKNFWLDYKTLEKLLTPDQFKDIKVLLLKTKKADEHILQLVDPVVFKTERDLLELEWKQKAEEARTRGVQVHEQLHNLLLTDLKSCKLNFGIPTDQYQVMKTEAFMNSSGLFPEFRMEVLLEDGYMLVGIADLIIKDENKITIIDYKSDEKIEKNARFDLLKNKKKTLKYPLSKIPDCNLSHYQLQVSIYAWMLQQLNPDLEIETLEIFHIKEGKIKAKYTVEYLKKEVDTLIKWHLKSYKLKIETDKCKEVRYE